MTKSSKTYLKLTKGLAIYKQNSNVWWCRIRHNKQEVRKSLKTSDIDEATRQAWQYKFHYEELEKKGIFEERSITVQKVAKALIRDIEAKDEDLKKTTDIDYIRHLELRVCKFWNDRKIESITTDDINQLKKDAEITSITQNNTLNKALKMLFEKAVKIQCMKADKVPVIEKYEVKNSIPRSFFRKSEIKRIFIDVNGIDEAYIENYNQDFGSNNEKANPFHFVRGLIHEWAENSNYKKTVKIRKLTVFYIFFLLLSGLRSGKECSFKFKDVSIDDKLINIKKGKLSSKNPNRKFVITDDILDFFGYLCFFKRNGSLLLNDEIRHLNREDLRKEFVSYKNQNPNEVVFSNNNKNRIADFNHRFTEFIDYAKEKNVLIDDSSIYTLYSFRHTYITFELLKGKMSHHELARHLDTSTEMIDVFYSKISSEMFKDKIETSNHNFVDIDLEKSAKRRIREEIEGRYLQDYYSDEWEYVSNCWDNLALMTDVDKELVTLLTYDLKLPKDLQVKADSEIELEYSKWKNNQ
ncbi:MAG: site-specific integrase [Gammaproteobacteria bacterium]|nr:site-specific integrase [Gammaproteobacteria bacterium]